MEPHDSPTAWFCALERARRTRDAALELRALQELTRLGVLVYWPDGSWLSKSPALRREGVVR